MPSPGPRMTPSRFARLQRVLRARQPDLTVLMDAVHKSHNIAAILRTCDATGVFRIHAVDPDGDVSRNHMAAGGTGRYVGLRIHDTVREACESDLRRVGRGGSPLVFLVHPLFEPGGPQSFHHLVQVQDGPFAHGPGQGTVHPDGFIVF